MLKMTWMLLFLTFGFHAAAMTSSNWYCGLQTTLTGEPGHFVGFASDGWKSESNLECFDGVLATSRRVAVSFSSLEASFGADARSRLHVAVAVQSFDEPSDIVVHMVAAEAGNNGLIWRFEGRGQVVEARVIPRSKHMDSNERRKLSTSLQSGMLMIRPVQ